MCCVIERGTHILYVRALPTPKFMPRINYPYSLPSSLPRLQGTIDVGSSLPDLTAFIPDCRVLGRSSAPMSRRALRRHFLAIAPIAKIIVDHLYALINETYEVTWIDVALRLSTIDCFVSFSAESLSFWHTCLHHACEYLLPMFKLNWKCYRDLCSNIVSRCVYPHNSKSIDTSLDVALFLSTSSTECAPLHRRSHPSNVSAILRCIRRSKSGTQLSNCISTRQRLCYRLGEQHLSPR